MDSNIQYFNIKNSLQSKLRELFKRRWVLVIFGILLLTSFFFLLSRNLKPKEGTTSLPIETQPVINTTPSKLPIITRTSSYTPEQFTPEQLKAIEEQSAADKVVGSREIEIRTKYPWFISLPLRGDKYFVYFEPNSKVFTGLLYPKAGDDIEAIKSNVKVKLQSMGIDTISYQYEWKVNPR